MTYNPAVTNYESWSRAETINDMTLPLYTHHRKVDGTTKHSLVDKHCTHVQHMMGPAASPAILLACVSAFLVLGLVASGDGQRKRPYLFDGTINPYSADVYGRITPGDMRARVASKFGLFVLPSKLHLVGISSFFI